MYILNNKKTNINLALIDIFCRSRNLLDKSQQKASPSLHSFKDRSVYLTQTPWK